MAHEPQTESSTDSVTAQLASHIRTTPVSSDTRAKAAKSFLDTIGVILAGAASEAGEPILGYVGRSREPGSYPILGTRITASAELAALANGTFGHALDFDDGIVLAPLHPSAVIVAALLTDARKLSGRDILNAYVCGLEVAVRMATAVGIGHYHHGWHGTSTAGIFGAVAALARARRLDEPMIRTALGIAVSMASGVQRNFGTMTKPLHSGWAARNGVAAVELAWAGLSGAQDALEAKYGYFNVYGQGDSDLTLLKRFGSPYVVDDPGLSLKRHACCYASHRPMEGLLAVRREVGLTEANVRSIKCFLAPGSMHALIYPRPTTGLEGKFSLEYALAAGVLDGGYSLWTFTDAAVQRPAAQQLLAKMHCLEDPRCAVGDPHAKTRGPSRRGFVEVHAETTDGRKAMQRVDRLPGSPDWELRWDELREKFLDCARSASVNATCAGKAFERLVSLEEQKDFAAILDLLKP